MDVCYLDSIFSRYGYKIYSYDTLDSTNTQCARLLKGGVLPPFAVLCEHQSSGRGRRGRNWFSPFAENIYFSFVIRFSEVDECFSVLGLVVALGVLSGINEFGFYNAKMKWPNDIYLNGKKVAGVLLEVSGSRESGFDLIVGVGVNVNMANIPCPIDQPWTSMILESGEKADRTILLGCIFNNLMNRLGEYEKSGFSSMREEWEENHIWQGKRCSLISGESEVTGIVLGVNAHGKLKMLVNDVECLFSAGELSLRCVYDF